MKKSHSFVAIPPGATIKEQLVDRGMKQKEFAARMGMSEKHISKLINGEVQLTIEMARKLEMVLGAPTQFWCNLESIYREDIVKVEEEKSMDEDIVIARNMPYEQLVEKGWIVDVVNNTERVVRLRKYFELAELKLLQATFLSRIACRRLSEMEKDDCVLIAWAQKAKLEAREVETAPIDMEKLKAEVPRISDLLKKSNEFDSKVQEILASCGVALVLLPCLEKEFLHGATFRDGNKIVVGLTVCDSNITELCFSLFHEIAHIIYGHIEKTEEISEDDEKCADEYARSILGQ